jgi:O-antigen/teichoic acid export membrane protein
MTKRPFVRGVISVASGAAIAQLVGVLLSPIITRLYGPEAYGVFDVFVSATGVLVPLAGLTYQHAIALPSDDRDALALLGLSNRISLGVSAIVALILAVFADQIARVLHFPGSSWMLLLIAPMILLTGLRGALNQWLIRQRRFTIIGGVDAGKELVIGGTKIGVGTVAPTAGALVLMTVVGSVLHTVLLLVGVRSSWRRPSKARREDARERRRSVARNYADFPLYREPQVFLNGLSMGLPPILLAAFFGPLVAGLYGIGRRVLQLPALLVSQSVGTVFLPHVAETARAEGDVKRLILRATVALAAVGVIPFGLIIILGPQMFGLVFGSEWTTAGEYARWLSLWSYCLFINTPSVQSIPALGLQGGFLVYEVATTTVRIGALLVGALLLQSALATIIIFSAVGAICNLALVVWVLVASRTSRREHF